MVLFPIHTLNKILWIRENEPRIFSRMDKFLCWEDFINFKLTGKAVIDQSLASRTMMFDTKQRTWSDEILDELSIDLLAQVNPSGRVVGEISPRGAKETGLSRETLIVTGGHDQACGCLGAGVLDTGPLYDVTGTVECLIPSNEEPVLNDDLLQQGYGNYCHVVPGRYLILGYNMTAGSILRWFMAQFGHREILSRLA